MSQAQNVPILSKRVDTVYLRIYAAINAFQIIDKTAFQKRHVPTLFRRKFPHNMQNLCNYLTNSARRRLQIMQNI